MTISKCRFSVYVQGEMGRDDLCILDPTRMMKCEGYRRACPQYASSAFTDIETDAGPKEEEIGTSNGKSSE